MDSPGTARNGLGNLGDEANVLGVSGHNEDDRNRPMGPQNASEPERTRPEQSEKEYSLGRPQDQTRQAMKWSYQGTSRGPRDVL